MRAEIRWKLGIIAVLILIGVIILVPSISAKIAEGLGISDFKGPFNGQPIRQGLDLRGGMEIVLGPDYRVNTGLLDQVGANLLERIGRVNVTGPSIGYLGLLDLGKYEGLIFNFASATEAKKVMVAGVIQEDLTWQEGGNDLHLLLQPKQDGSSIKVNVVQAAKDFPTTALARAETILKDRVNRLGLSEPDIRLDDKNHRILVQLPSVTSEKEAADILQRTGRLNFRLDGKKVLYGDDLRSARAQYDGGQAIISFEFGSVGAQRLRYITERNLKKNMAVYLDEEELMNPVIQTVIPDGKGQIELGNASIEEAKKYAILMEAGSLPISLRNLSVNQVAPTLGKEIIQQSLMAGLVGLGLIMAFMLALYGVVGTIADVALMIFALLSLSALALFRGVLTLPGVAGFLLSIGMAVDANIIIFERIKDELRAGKRMRAALEGGFSRAFWTIFDSNMTALITGLVLLFFGYGAVRGFAVTLIIGILISIFTALVVTRIFLELMIERNPDRFARHFRA